MTLGQYVPVGDITANCLVYTPTTFGTGTGTAYDNWQFQVQNNGGIDNNGIDTDPTARTMTINVTWVNQGPAGADNGVTTLENQPYVFGQSDFGFSDPVNGNHGAT